MMKNCHMLDFDNEMRYRNIENTPSKFIVPLTVSEPDEKVRAITVFGICFRISDLSVKNYGLQ